MMTKKLLRQIDFVMAYNYAPIKTDHFIEIPYGIETTEGNTQDYVLQLLANIYAGRVWNLFLIKMLESIGFVQFKVDERVFYRSDVVFIVCVDDGILLGRFNDQLTKIIKELTDIGVEVEDQGHPADYMGINIKCLADCSCSFS
ncbi:hypothetical protein ACHAW6_009079 [Cyclotella cf. meneghiniana]